MPCPQTKVTFLLGLVHCVGRICCKREAIMNKHPAKQVQGCRTYQVATLVVALHGQKTSINAAACKTATVSMFSTGWAYRL